MHIEVDPPALPAAAAVLRRVAEEARGVAGAAADAAGRAALAAGSEDAATAAHAFGGRQIADLLLLADRLTGDAAGVTAAAEAYETTDAIAMSGSH